MEQLFWLCLFLLLIQRHATPLLFQTIENSSKCSEITHTNSKSAADFFCRQHKKLPQFDPYGFEAAPFLTRRQICESSITIFEQARQIETHRAYSSFFNNIYSSVCRITEKPHLRNNAAEGLSMAISSYSSCMFASFAA